MTNVEASLKLGFRRRCGWCGVALRGWQLNLCRRCRSAVNEPIVRTSPCVSGSRWDEAPDRWRWWWNAWRQP